MKSIINQHTQKQYWQELYVILEESNYTWIIKNYDWKIKN